MLFFLLEKREKSFPSFSLHFQRLASLKPSALSLFSLLSLLLFLLHLLIDHQTHVLLQQDERFRWLAHYQYFLSKDMNFKLYILAHRLTCQASSSWDSTTLCWMVLRSCCVNDSFSWRTMANSLSRELYIYMEVSKTYSVKLWLQWS